VTKSDASSETSRPVLFNAHNWAVAAVSATRAISTSTACQTFVLIIGRRIRNKRKCHPFSFPSVSLFPFVPSFLSAFFDAKFIQRPRVVAPVALHADKQVQADVATKQLFDVAARSRPDGFQHLAALADDDRFL